MDLLLFLLSILFICTLVQGLISIARVNKTSFSKLPPGPTPLPVIGNLHKLGQQPHKSLAELAKTYGPIMTLKLGQITTVVISSSAMAREVLQKHDISLSKRSVPNALRARNHSQLSVIWLPVSTRWRNLRKIMNSNIFSSHKLDSTQRLRCQKVSELITYVSKCCEAGVAVDIGRASFSTTLNLLSNTFFSVDLVDPNSDTVQEFKDLVSSITEGVGKPNLVDYFPILEKLDPQRIRHRMSGDFVKLIELFDNMISHRLELRQVNGCTANEDVLDTLLNISEENGDMIDKTHIERLLLDLFVAANDTTSVTIEWAMTELLRNPDTLTKARTELHQIIGKGNLLQESDISKLPYLQSIVKETFRIHSPAPLLIPHEANAETEVCGFTIPKGAKVVVNAWNIGRDPSIWVNPNSFMPERFLGSEIDVKGHDFELIPFGAGRRICPGLPLATRMVHLMLGSLINSFDWKLEGGIAPEELNMDEKFGITLQKVQSLCAVPIRL